MAVSLLFNSAVMYDLKEFLTIYFTEKKNTALKNFFETNLKSHAVPGYYHTVKVCTEAKAENVMKLNQAAQGAQNCQTHKK